MGNNEWQSHNKSNKTDYNVKLVASEKRSLFNYDAILNILLIPFYLPLKLLISNIHCIQLCVCVFLGTVHLSLKQSPKLTEVESLSCIIKPLFSYLI